MRATTTRAASQRGQGQWALNHFEPLNAAERFKKDDAGLNVRDRIIGQYAAMRIRVHRPDRPARPVPLVGPVHPAPARHSGRQDGLLEDEEIEDSYFMMRVRIPGGQLSTEQLRTIGGISKEYGRDVADITDRQNVQFHWIRIEDVPTIWERLDEVGLSSIQACGDVPRNILGCPVAGIDAEEIIDATAVLRATEAVAAGNPEFGELAAQVQDRDLGLRLALHRARDQRHLLRRRPGPGRHSRFRPVGRRRPVHQPDARQSGSASSSSPTRSRPSGRA